MSGLRERTWPKWPRGPDRELLDGLYIPALSAAVRYDRMCAYFSSSVLSVAALGFSALIKRLEGMGDQAPTPAVRLLVNEELSEPDVRALTETGDLSTLEKRLKARFKDPTDALRRDRLGMLAWLVKKNWLEVRVGVMRRGGGILHGKVGIVTDSAGDAIVFRGSGNESAHALVGNFETFEVSTSWEAPEVLRHHADEFEAMWKNEDPHVLTVPLPEALKRQLIKFVPDEPPLFEPSVATEQAKAAMIWRFISEAPYFPNGAPACDATMLVDLWPHQRHVVAESADAWPNGRLLCDEVGMGKTVEAIGVLRRLLAGRGVKRVLILPPAGLVRQWQGELREKGGLLFPRFEGGGVTWPDESPKRMSLADALKEDRLIMSRETARTENNLPFLLQAPPWDLVILDEAHAARRSAVEEEGEFNSANYLLAMLRELQLRRQARGILLMSATPMQTQPWEPWDLLAVLGEGGQWLDGDFDHVRDFYTTVVALERGERPTRATRRAAGLVAADLRFPPLDGVDLRDAKAVEKTLRFGGPDRRRALAAWLRRGSPLARRMHRNTRQTLARYCAAGLIEHPPPQRIVEDCRFDYLDPAERAVYDRIRTYIERRFDELEAEKKGKGFVMTVYRRRATSSPQALAESLKRRRDGLQSVIQRGLLAGVLGPDEAPESMDLGDLGDPDLSDRISLALPADPRAAAKELREVEDLLRDVEGLQGKDTKRDEFWKRLRAVLEDGRSALVFTEYTDTMEYVRDGLAPYYGRAIGSFCGGGGHRRNGTGWEAVGKGGITAALMNGELKVLVCTDAASEGLNLQAAGALINYDLHWNPSRIEQRIGRIDRIGQKHAQVRVVNLFLMNSVDDQVYGALRRRCGMFERFVGPMQPVLATARRALLYGPRLVPLGQVSATADRARDDVLAREFFKECEASPRQEGPTPVSRSDIVDAVRSLPDVPGLVVKPLEGGETWRIRIAGSKKRITVSLAPTRLDADPAALPLVPGSETVASIANALQPHDCPLPLVVGSYLEGPFRAVVPLWTGGGRRQAVATLADLRRLLDAWDGQPPAPEDLLRAQDAADREAKRRVRGMQKDAQREADEALAAQITAARRRLVRELGRFLVSLGAQATSAALNDAFHRHMTGPIAGAERLRRAHQVLGGYPEWDEALLEELTDFEAHLNDKQRRARTAGAELEAALNDPRWRARET